MGVGSPTHVFCLGIELRLAGLCQLTEPSLIPFVFETRLVLNLTSCISFQSVGITSMLKHP